MHNVKQFILVKIKISTPKTEYRPRQNLKKYGSIVKWESVKAKKKKIWSTKLGKSIESSNRFQFHWL